MANNNSAKGNPASKRMQSVAKKNKRINNKIKNEKLRAKGEHPKQIRDRENRLRHLENVDRRNLPKAGA